MSEVKTKHREPWYLSNDNDTDEWCITDGVETFPLARATPAEFGLALNGTIERAQAISLPDRETLRPLIDEASATLAQHDRVWANTSSNPLPTSGVSAALRKAIPVLVALPTQPADEQVRGVQGWMALDLHMALGKEPDMRSEVENQGHSSWADWWAELCGEVRALSTQPAAGEVEWAVKQIHDGRILVDDEDGEPLDEDAARELIEDLPYRATLMQRTVGPWIEVQPEPAPELANLFPGTLAALDHLSIRPEVQ